MTETDRSKVKKIEVDRTKNSNLQREVVRKGYHEIQRQIKITPQKSNIKKPV